MNTTITKAKRHIARARELSSRSKSPLTELTEEQIIAKIRRDRETIWGSKHATRT